LLLRSAGFRRVSISEHAGRLGILPNQGSTEDGVRALFFYDVLLARLDERDFKLYA
jgi:hypothetical protein